jgi:hypothetical protein
MAHLDSAVKALKDALDALEERLGDRLHDLAQETDAADAARRHARAAREAANEASDLLAAAIDDLKDLVAAADPRRKE